MPGMVLGLRASDAHQLNSRGYALGRTMTRLVAMSIFMITDQKRLRKNIVSLYTSTKQQTAEPFSPTLTSFGC